MAMSEPSIRKLRELCLLGMADAYQAQAANPAAYEGMPFEDRFAMCVDAECDKRATSKLDRLIKDARFRFPDASPEGFDFSANRQLDRPQIARLFECRFIDEGRDVIITGVTGTGKTWLSCAIGKAACRRHKTVRYIRLPAFFSDLACAKEAGRYDKALAKYVRYNLLILDDWLLYKCSKDEQHDIYELIEARDHLSPTIFCSQFSEDGWLQRLGKVPSSEGALARITKAGVIKVAFSTASDMRNQHSLVKDSANE